ncbi:phosphatase PAP2 family protein [candidate division FCPU426 bacterium]|nr:phosphatase PAP2 family protein [candidate division FCPU426 bacterium]
MSVLTFLHEAAAMDVALFRFINDTLYLRSVAQAIYFLAHDRLILAVLLAAAIVYGYRAGWRTAAAVSLWGAVAVLLANLFHNQGLKYFFNRQRPFLSLPDVHLCVPLNDLSNVSLSFPSTHAASAAALVVVAACLDRRLTGYGILFALVIGLGTVYSGGHYPADVLAGYLLGAGVGWAVYRFSLGLWPRDAATWLMNKKGD